MRYEIVRPGNSSPFEQTAPFANDSAAYLRNTAHFAKPVRVHDVEGEGALAAYRSAVSHSSAKAQNPRGRAMQLDDTLFEVMRHAGSRTSEHTRRRPLVFTTVLLCICVLVAFSIPTKKTQVTSPWK